MAHIERAKAIAGVLYAKVLDAWASEDKLNEVFMACGRGPTMDRTAHGRAIVEHLFKQAWREVWTSSAELGHGGIVPVHTDADVLLVSWALVPLFADDFNLGTQVLCNLSTASIAPKSGALQTDLQALQDRFNGVEPSPWTAKKKARLAYAPGPVEDQQLITDYNRALDLLKTKDILESFVLPSFRVSPMRATPALADSQNLSMLPVAGDAYLALGGDCRFLAWDPTELPVMLAGPDEEGHFTCDSLPAGRQTFVSKSGDTRIMESVLSARFQAWELYKTWASMLSSVYNNYGSGPMNGAVLFMPRMSSVLVIGPEALVAELSSQYPLLASRAAQAPA